MRREQDFEDAALVLVLIALVLMIAVVAAMSERHGRSSQDEHFMSVDHTAPTFGFTSPLLAQPGEQVRVNELPQITR